MISANESNELNELKFGSAKAEIKSDGKITERKTILVTGGSGRLGDTLIQTLVGEGGNVISTTREAIKAEAFNREMIEKDISARSLTPCMRTNLKLGHLWQAFSITTVRSTDLYTTHMLYYRLCQLEKCHGLTGLTQCV